MPSHYYVCISITDHNQHSAREWKNTFSVEQVLWCISMLPYNDKFHWTCHTLEIHQIGQPPYSSVQNPPYTKISISTCTARWWGIRVYGFGGFRGGSIFSGKCDMTPTRILMPTHIWRPHTYDAHSHIWHPFTQMTFTHMTPIHTYDAHMHMTPTHTMTPTHIRRPHTYDAHSHRWHSHYDAHSHIWRLHT